MNNDVAVIALATVAVLGIIGILILALRKLPAPVPMPPPAPEEKKPAIQFTVYYPHLQLSLQGVTRMTLTDSQQVHYSIAIIDKQGNPAQVDGVPEWASSDPSLLALEVAADGMSAVAIAQGPLGHLQVTVTADADLGSGVVPIIGVEEIDIVGGQAVAIKLQAGEPEEQ